MDDTQDNPVAYGEVGLNNDATCLRGPTSRSPSTTSKRARELEVRANPLVTIPVAVHRVGEEEREKAQRCATEDENAACSWKKRAALEDHRNKLFYRNSMPRGTGQRTLVGH